MYNSPFVLFLTLLASLVSALPSTLYRGDARTPSVIKDGSGFKARGHDANPSQSKLFDHVEESLDHPDQDPFISTSDDSSVAKQAENGKAYLYTLDASKITEKIWDVADEYKKAGKKYVNAPEKEFAVQNAIPWGAVTKIQKKDDKGVWQDVPLPTTAVQPAAVSLTCQGTGGSKYINRDGIINVIYKFCEEAEKQNVLDKDSGSIARTYNKDTPEQVDIALDHKPGLNWSPTKNKCVEQMMIATDGCDTASNHWKGGGVRKDTDVTYRWAPSKARSVPVEEAAVWGGCEGTYGGWYTVWGAHWAGDDFGSELLNSLKSKGISPTQWKFNYGGGDDHREWTAWFQTIIHAWGQVEDSMESVGKWGLDIRCNIG